MTASDFILHLSFKASHTAAGGVAPVYAPLLHPANEPSTWRASLIPPYAFLVKTYRVGGKLNTDASRGGSLDEDNNQLVERQSRKLQFVLFHGGFNWQISGKDPESCSGTLEQEGSPPTPGTEPRSSSSRQSLGSRWAATLLQYLLFTVFRAFP